MDVVGGLNNLLECLMPAPVQGGVDNLYTPCPLWGSMVKLCIQLLHIASCILEDVVQWL